MPRIFKPKFKWENAFYVKSLNGPASSINVSKGYITAHKQTQIVSYEKST